MDQVAGGEQEADPTEDPLSVSCCVICRVSCLYFVALIRRGVTLKVRMKAYSAQMLVGFCLVFEDCLGLGTWSMDSKYQRAGEERLFRLMLDPCAL